jgi:hypothetical protein
MKVIENAITACKGRLMSPNEVRSAVQNLGRTLPKQYQHGWYLCGDVTTEFFYRLKGGAKTTEAIDCFSVKGGQLFTVFSLQIGEQQARFLLPLASEKSLRFLEQVERTGVFLSLGKEGATDALLIEFKSGRTGLRELQLALKRCAHLPCDVDPVVLSLASFSMMQKKAVPSADPLCLVAEVCLTVVLDD